MNILITRQKQITFTSINLKEKEHQQSEFILAKIKSNPQDSEKLKWQLFSDIFQKHIEKEANKKSKGIYYSNEVCQEMCLKFFEILNNIKNSSTESIINALNQFKPDNNALQEKYRFKTISINTNIGYNDSSLTLKEKLTEQNQPVYVSNPSYKDIKETKQKLKNIEKRTNLSPKEKIIIKKLKENKSRKKISKELNISNTSVGNRISAAILKMQNSQGILPKKFEEYVELLGQEYSLEENEIKILKNNLIKQSHIIHLNINYIINNINKISKLLDIDAKTFVQSTITQPQIFCFKPETVQNNIIQLSKETNTPLTKITKAALKQPNLFQQKTSTLMNNINELVKITNIPKEKVIKMALKQPSLFCLSPKTIQNNINELIKKTGMPKNKLTQIIQQQPTILASNSDTLIRNIQELSQKLNITPEITMKLALKQSNLFYQKHDTLIKNLNTLAKKFNIQLEQIIKSALKQPSIFCLKPETIQNNIIELSKKLNTTKENVIKAALLEPNIFCQKPDTINNNITELAKQLEIDKKILMNVALKQPHLLCRNPETLIKNIIELAEKTKKTKAEIVKYALTEPSLFHQNPETILKKVKINDFYKIIKNKPDNKLSFSHASDDALYEKILIYLIKQNDKLDKLITPKKLVEYLVNQNKTYEFNIPNHELKNELIKFIQDFSNTQLKKQIFILK